MTKHVDLNESAFVDEAPSTANLSWGGTTLVLIGLAGLLVSFAFQRPISNWWAVFILIPPVIAFNIAWISYARRGNLAGIITRIALSSGVIVLTVGLLFLFDASWRVWWPLMVIVPSTTLLANSLSSPFEKTGPILSSMISMIAWLSGSATLLGLVFLIDRLEVVKLYEYFGPFQWWGIFILIPGLAAMLNALILYRYENTATRLTAMTLLTGGLITCTTAAITLLGLKWNILDLLTSFILISLGVSMLVGRYFPTDY